MRAGILLLLVACTTFDPIAEVPNGHREFRDTQTAVQAILAEHPRPRVFAVGEYHVTQATASATSSLTRFTRDIIALLEPYAAHLVVEAWVDGSCWGNSRKAQEVTAATQRPGTTSMEVMQLVRRSRKLQLRPHTLPMTCIEIDSVVDASGRIDFYLLLLIVTYKLGESTRALLGDDRAVIVYGGALHNDLHPRYAMNEFTYAVSLERDLGPSSVLEIDLIVPEVVAPLQMVRREDWFPLLARAAPDRVLVWRRGPSSYVVILPAQSQDVAKVAKLVDRS